MAGISVVLLLAALLLLCDRLFSSGVLGLFVPAYAAVIAAFLGFLFALLRRCQVIKRPRSKNKLKKVRRAQALMVLNLAACVAAAALWFMNLAALL